MWQTEIEIHFAKMEELSEKLLDLSERLKTFVDRNEMETISEIKAAWVSENVDAFTGKEMRTFEKIKESAVNLKSMSSEIHEKVRQLYELEQRNIMTAEIRSYR